MNDVDNQLTQLSPSQLPAELRAPASRPAPESLWQTISVELDADTPIDEPQSHPLWRGLAAVAAVGVLVAGAVGITRLVNPPGDSPQPGAPVVTQSSSQPSQTSSPEATQPGQATRGTPLPLAEQDIPLSAAQTQTAFAECAQIAAQQNITVTGEWTVLYAMTKILSVAGPDGPYRFIVLGDGHTWISCASDPAGVMDLVASAPQSAQMGIPTTPSAGTAGMSVAALTGRSSAHCLDNDPTVALMLKGDVGYRVSPDVVTLRARLVVNGTPQQWATTVPDRGLAYLVWGTTEPVKASDVLKVEVQALDANGTPLVIQGDVDGNPRLGLAKPGTTMTVIPNNPCKPA